MFLARIEGDPMSKAYKSYVVEGGRLITQSKNVMRIEKLNEYRFSKGGHLANENALPDFMPVFVCRLLARIRARRSAVLLLLRHVPVKIRALLDDYHARRW